MPYMEKRKDGWLWVQRRVPRDLVPIIGSQWLRENTKTKDPPEYDRRSLPIIAKHNAILEQAERLSGFRRFSSDCRLRWRGSSDQIYIIWRFLPS